MIQHAKFLFNGAVVDETMLRRWPMAEELLVADGLFETIKVLGGRPVFIAAHHARLSASCRALGLPWSLSMDALHERCETLLKVNCCVEGSLKIVVFPEPAGGCGELIFSREPAYSTEDYCRGFHLKTQVDVGRASGPTHKSTKYLKNLRAREAARAAGFDDALFLDQQRNVLEGAATTLFIVRNGQLLTPPLAVGILPGVARGEILRRWEGGPAEQAISAEMLDGAEEVFVTNALLGVMPVSAIDQRAYRMEQYVVTRRLMAKFSAWQATSIAG